MEPVNIIHSLCIKIGDYQNLYTGNFIGKFILKRKINRLIKEFLSNDIFRQSSALAGVLISLNSSNSNILQERLDGKIRISKVSIEMKVNDAFVSYIPKEELFEVDTAYNSVGGIKFNYNRFGSGSSKIDSIWQSMVFDIESTYLNTIYIIADVLNNPAIKNVQDDGIDPFVN